jgi:hypothetical protein
MNFVFAEPTSMNCPAQRFVSQTSQGRLYPDTNAKLNFASFSLNEVTSSEAYQDHSCSSYSS